MKIKYLILAMFIMTSAFSESLKGEYQVYVNNFKVALRSEDKKDLIKLFRFPINRSYPVPEIKDGADFIKRFDHMFDEKVIKEILNSSTENDWGTVGWRGIMLNQGTVWIDYDGAIIAINHSTKKEELFKKDILKQIKQSIHSSLHNFKLPKAYLETKKYKIRLDLMSSDTYRYAAWLQSKNTKEKPDLVLNNGTMTFDGSGGNHHYTFKNKKFKYEIYVNRIGKSKTPPASLLVYKEDKILIEQDAVKFKN